MNKSVLQHEVENAHEKGQAPRSDKKPKTVSNNEAAALDGRSTTVGAVEQPNGDGPRD